MLHLSRTTPWLFALGALLGCADPTDPAVPAELQLAAIAIAGGDNQTAVIRNQLPVPLAVTVTSPSGRALPGIRIQFAIGAGGGTVEPGDAITDSAGGAATTLTLGSGAGPVTVVATLPGTAQSATLHATALAPDLDSTSAAAVYNPDWTTASHGKAPPDYPTVFPQSSVPPLEIVIAPAQWASVGQNMWKLYGFDFGGDRQPSVTIDEDPDYIPVLIRFRGKAWKKVGFRLKGQASLSYSWGSGVWKLPFKLKMSEFENVYPAIKGQRLFGFKELSFAPGFVDNSLIRDKVTADLFRAAGVPAARTAFYRVSIDFGTGLKYCGVYTIVETIDDTMVKDQFGEDSGNIYKPESQFRFFRTNQFEKKNNKTAADYSDIQAVIVALNAPSRTRTPAEWRTGLEARFDVDHFLRWLAVSNTVVNWDSYGTLAHNYYLYHPSKGGIKWIPWDHNQALIGSPGLSGQPLAGAADRAGLTLTMNEVDKDWPLIRYLVDDSVYVARYRDHLKGFLTSGFAPAVTTAMLETAHALIAPYVVGPAGERPGYSQLSSPAAFTASLEQLKAHVDRRRALVGSFVP